MDVLTRTTQSPLWVAQERASAEHAVRVHAGDAYMVLRNRTILATIDWVEGRRTHAPATGKPRHADDSGLAQERRDAEDRESDAWAMRDEDTALRAGVVAEFLAAYLCDPMAVPPS